MTERRVGVFVCHCGENIAGVVDVKRVVSEVSKDEHVYYVRDYRFMCSREGQKLIEDSIREKGLNRIVVACCTPKLHERTFRRVLERAGLNPFLLEIANIREQCAWVHYDDPERATEKAIDIVRAAVHRALNLEEIGSIESMVEKRALIIGGGVAGIQAALDLASKGIDVVLVERSPTLGGIMATQDKVYPTMDCSLCILAPKMAEAYYHDRINVLTLAELKNLDGYPGNFEAEILLRPRYVDISRCTACGACSRVCPVSVPDEFNAGLGERKAIYIPFQQAVPRAYVIDPKSCLYLTKGECGKCAEVCPNNAINFEDSERSLRIRVGAIIVATGFKEFDPTPLKQYGYGDYDDVLTNLQLSRLIHPEGPTKGKLLRPSDGKEARSVVFIQCVGSRDERFHSYCSRTCCMVSLKLANLIKTKNPDVDVYICYIDLRTYGREYEEFAERVKSLGVKLVRGKPSEIVGDRESGKLRVRVLDTVTNELLEIDADIVSLACAMEPSEGADELARILGIDLGPDSFFRPLHPKLEPVSTKITGIYICGAAAGPADISESVAQAKAAASEAASFLLAGEVEIPMTIASVNLEICTGCGACVEACPYNAITIEESGGRKIARVVELACRGCGACAVACPTGAIQLNHYRHDQMLPAIESMMGVLR